VIVVDASALSAFVLREEGWRNLAGYLANAVAPDHVVKEVANAVWRATRTGALTEEESRKAFSLLLRMVDRNLVLEPELRYLGEAFRVSLTYGITVYMPSTLHWHSRETYLYSPLMRGRREWRARWAYT
jgi:predicted nucleic acid-binding protein